MKIEMKILNKEFYLRKKMGGEYYDTPNYQTLGSEAIDLVCTEDITLAPAETKMVKTGLAIWIGSTQWPVSEIEHMGPDGGYISHYEPLSVAGIIAPRSGLGTKGLVLANTIGIIDSDYQGELVVAAHNRTFAFPMVLELKAGDRFAQLMLVPVIKAHFEIVDEFSANTRRGRGGFGHSGE